MTNMIIDYIDPAFHGSSFPATYVAPGNLQALGVAATQGAPAAAASLPATSPQYVAGDTNTYTLRAASARQSSGGDLTLSVAAATASLNFAVIPVGFFPSKIEVLYNNAVLYQWFAGSTDIFILTVSGNTVTVAANGTGYVQVTADAAGGDGSVCYITLGATILSSTGAYTVRVSK